MSAPTFETDTAAPILSKGQKQAADVSDLIRARNPLLWVVTREEARVEGFLAEAALAAGYVPHVWDVAQGFTTIEGKIEKGGAAATDLGEALNVIRAKTEDSAKAERGVWIMRDLPAWVTGPLGFTALRQLRNLARLLPGVARDRAQAIVILTTSGEVPPDLAGHVTVVEWPLPDRSEIAAVLDAAIGSLREFEIGEDKKPDPKRPLRALAAPNGIRDQAIDAAVGLTSEEAAACYARSLVRTKKIDPALVAGEKKRIIAREKVLEWHDPIPGGMDAVGGLETLKAWLLARKLAYTPKARAYGLPAPKGVFLAGVSGCGKSLTAKAIATTWGVPLLKLDLGALKSKFVGGSETNLRKAFEVIQAIGRCVVWIDEIEKALQGATSGSSDGGVSADALGAVLTWMQERAGEAFVIATANDISGLPPELLRKGRFDELFFVDLPTAEERESVLTAALKAHGRGKVAIDLTAVSDTCVNFTGAEIAAIVPEALFVAFNDDAREINTDDLIKVASGVVPLSKTAVEKITALRTWATTRAKPASAPTTRKAVKSAGRQLDVDA